MKMASSRTNLFNSLIRYTCLSVSPSVCVQLCMYVCVHACMSECMYACLRVCFSLCVCLFVRLYLCACTLAVRRPPTCPSVRRQFILDRLPLLPAQLYHGTHLPRTIHRVHAHRACLVRREPMTCPDPESIVSPPDRFLLSVTFLRHNTL